ncbi:MAG: hypothetical protein IKJ65_07495 [Clostridia bacterium]|nr:hypothetical protein [Clostridia bacterium]
MLYPKSKEKALSRALFENPTSEYRGAPFWAWNGKLDKDELFRQIEIFKKMGLGGFHMHVRTGMDTEYLSDEFMDYISACLKKAKEEDMLSWLYDEDRWPSGTCGGRITRGKSENARKSLLITVNPHAPRQENPSKEPVPGNGQEKVRQENGTLLCVYDIVLNENGKLQSAKRISEADSAQGAKWYVYMEHATADPWFNNAAYVDTLSEKAIDEFIHSTHEKYFDRVGGEFGKRIPAIFTDEPQFTQKSCLNFAFDMKDVFLPWTDGLEKIYFGAYGEDLFDLIPELLWEKASGELSRARWRFQNLLADRFVENYVGKIGSWCERHNLYLTGHVMGEGDLYSQTQAVGDAMRSYRRFGLPGVDILCDFHEYNTLKQTQSIVRQTGKEGMLSELYGVTGWDADFRLYKLQGDWQAALGVTARVPHLAWMTMKGEAKRDYPASISYQSPWHGEFSLIENHFARLNTALTRGKAVVRTAVVHPVESYWLYWGPNDQTGEMRAQMEKSFAALTEALLFGNIDFDFLCEAELPVLCEKAENPLKVGEMAYDAVIVPNLTTIRSTTLERLADFHHAGGTLIWMGECPKYVNAEISDAAQALYQKAIHISDSPMQAVNALDAFRALDIRRMDGTREDRMVHQMRADGDKKWLFIANGKNPTSPDVEEYGNLRFLIKGEYALTEYDTLTGKIRPVSAGYAGGNTIFDRKWHMHDSLLLLLENGRREGSSNVSETLLNNPDLTFENVNVELEEENMLLLDMAEYSVNGSAFFSEEEILRIDNLARKHLGIPLRRKEVCQPYLIAPEEAKDKITLRFTFESETETDGAYLALEDAEKALITFNDAPVENKPIGWFVDKAISKIALPGIRKGRNTLLVTYPIGRRTNLECLYLLGDFGVKVNGTKKTLLPPVKKLGFGDITKQGLPFYTGNLIYKFRIFTEGDFTLRIPRYKGALSRVYMDGADMGAIAFSPYTIHLPSSKGVHEIKIKLFQTRINGFGQLHHTPGVYFYQSPNSWRSADDLWTYEYQLKPAGIMKSPELYGAKYINELDETRTTLTRTENIMEVS